MDIKQMMPSHGFFPEYVKYARTQTDAPELFHLGTALAMFSAAAARTTTLAVPDCTPMPLHLWVLLVGQSGGARKSTAIQIGERVLATDPKKKEPFFPLMALSRSPEATFDLLARTPHGLLLHPEASSFFDAFRKPWWSQADGLLLDMFDGRTMKRVLTGRRTKKNPVPPPIEIEIKNPRVAFLGGISPAMICMSIREKDRIGGPLGRMLPLWGDRERFNPFPGKPRKGVEDRLRNSFQWRVTSTGPFQVRFAAEVWEQYKAWSRMLDYESCNYADDKRAMATRLQGHVLRVAALYRLGSIPEVNDAEVMERALAFGDAAKASILKLPPMDQPPPFRRRIKHGR